MNMESWSYAIIAMLLGMAVVFIFLGFLCFLMLLLKKIFTTEVKDGAEEKNSEEEQDKAETEIPEWLIAAVSAYLTIEEEEAYPYSAEVWKSDEGLTSWVSGGKFQKRGIGV